MTAGAPSRGKQQECEKFAKHRKTSGKQEKEADLSSIEAADL